MVQTLRVLSGYCSRLARANPRPEPIEHVWHQLKLRLNKYPIRAITISELEEGIKRKWYKFTKEDCLKYIDSMSRRIKAVIRSRGGPTRY
jgi:hypothetical protein